jgi:hypothetical protein
MTRSLKGVSAQGFAISYRAVVKQQLRLQFCVDEARCTNLELHMPFKPSDYGNAAVFSSVLNTVAHMGEASIANQRAVVSGHSKPYAANR